MNRFVCFFAVLYVVLLNVLIPMFLCPMWQINTVVSYKTENLLIVMGLVNFLSYVAALFFWSKFTTLTATADNFQRCGAQAHIFVGLCCGAGMLVIRYKILHPGEPSNLVIALTLMGVLLFYKVISRVLKN